MSSANAQLLKMVDEGHARQERAMATVVWQQALLGIFQGIVQMAADGVMQGEELQATAKRAVALGNDINDLQAAGLLNSTSAAKILEAFAVRQA